MATWKAENSMLTQRGVEILNKLKAGIGSITVTRVVIGSGRVPESRLYSQTSVSGVQKEVEISSYNTSDKGSEIVFYVSNTDFTESYDLHQIGIFVTHPDYEGEQLYHISQCDEADFDTIPSILHTPVTQGYSIYMEHGNSYAVTISVNTQGMVGREEFNAYKSTVCAVNILDNWYFINPRDSKQGLVVPPNTPYFNTMNETSNAGTTSSYTAVIAVNNDWCRLVIGGTDYYCPRIYAVRGYAEQGIGIDRFTLENAYALLTNSGLELTASNALGANDYAAIYQEIPFKNAQAFLELPVTVSILLADGRFASTTITDINDGMTGLLEGLTFGITYDSQNDSLKIFKCQIPSGQSITIRAVKTELGSQQTLAHLDPNGNWVLNEIPNYSAEIAKCNQYGSLVVAKSDAEIYTLLARYIGVMSDFETKQFNINVDNLGLSIDSGVWFMEINKVNPLHATVTAKKYDSAGVLIRVCSLNNGVFTKWSSITSSTTVLDAVVE